jgi:hypothetical protein
MKTFILLLLSITVMLACKKETKTSVCNMDSIYATNAAKVTITNGVWGTVSEMTGNCMPVIDPYTTDCTHCPIVRKVRIYPYTTTSNAVVANPGGFYSSFSTTLIAEVDTDALGFFQVTLPAGNYTVVVVEDGKLYSPLGDGFGGINPVTVAAGSTKMNLTSTYKAAF